MTRPSKINDLIWYLSVDKNGFTWNQLLGTHKGRGIVDGKEVNDVLNFPRKTLDRHLKTLIKNGIVEKTYVLSGKKGRPTGKYKLTGKYWEPNSLFGGTVPNMVRNEEGELLLVRTVRVHKTLMPSLKKRKKVKNNVDYFERIHGRKNIKKTIIVGDYFELLGTVLKRSQVPWNPYYDRGIKLNPCKEKFSPQRQGTGLTPQKKNCQRCGKPVHFILGANALCTDCLESPKESPES